ncbi:uncharacterized protein M421DRAFT_288794 [Didymella exigua CBS 183.55]|uniref:Extracellular membrane protein CFEM domain-containing protein n=1 Tax=Didymella exigua CBS 183.55 TaxID=1150837 RepID=A0A6A5RV11_9PLEO|nr:uncharacterized protein M421DRAFT_288794 [Didymella exigua CBS 183.55]KAF1932305.1 hypothetical protein M421DRAFT_288794 [Didymella exigua CBS 183.55]
MKYTAVLFAFAAGAFAQSSTITSAPATTAAAGTSPSISCVSACAAGDVTCQASCLGIARPNSSQAVETTECAAKCDQGDGTAEATQKYSDCVQGCIASLFPSSQTVSIPGAAAAASGSGASGSAAATGSNRASVPLALRVLVLLVLLVSWLLSPSRTVCRQLANTIFSFLHQISGPACIRGLHVQRVRSRGDTAEG